MKINRFRKGARYRCLLDEYNVLRQLELITIIVQNAGPHRNVATCGKVLAVTVWTAK